MNTRRSYERGSDYIVGVSWLVMLGGNGIPCKSTRFKPLAKADDGHNIHNTLFSFSLICEVSVCRRAETLKDNQLITTI